MPCRPAESSSSATGRRPETSRSGARAGRRRTASAARPRRASRDLPQPRLRRAAPAGRRRRASTTRLRRLQAGWPLWLPRRRQRTARRSPAKPPMWWSSAPTPTTRPTWGAEPWSRRFAKRCRAVGRINDEPGVKPTSTVRSRRFRPSPRAPRRTRGLVRRRRRSWRALIGRTYQNHSGSARLRRMNERKSLWDEHLERVSAIDGGTARHPVRQTSHPSGASNDDALHSERTARPPGRLGRRLVADVERYLDFFATA